MDRKGFTLFTALVAFVLIVLSVLLVHGMIRAERDRIDLIAGIEEQTTMQTIADMERSDAMQILIYDLRFIMERWLNEQSKIEGIGPICDMEEEKEKIFCSFDELVEDFAETYFVGEDGAAKRQMSEWMATSLMNLLPRVKEVGSYVIEIEDDKEGEVSVRDKLRDGLETLIEKSASSKEGEFFEVIDCENGNPEECIGTFYLNFRASELTDEEYEKLPQIIIWNTATGRTIRQAILPRENFRVYVPIRIFKAIAEARAVALEYNNEDWRTNYGLLSPRIHNEVEEMGFGMCDPRACHPRTNPYEVPQAINFPAKCPGGGEDSLVPINCPNASAELMDPCSVVEKYNPNDTGDTEEKLEQIVERRLEFIAGKNLENEELHPADDKFEFEGIDFTISADSTVSKNISPDMRGFNDQPNPNYHSYRSNSEYGAFGRPCPMEISGGGIGLFLEDGEVKKREIEEVLAHPSANRGFCSEVDSVEFIVFFKEMNENYVVNKKLIEEDGPVYGIKIWDTSYTPFTLKYKSGLDSDTCALQGDPKNNSQFPAYNVNDWKCLDTFEMGPVSDPTPRNFGCQVP